MVSRREHTQSQSLQGEGGRRVTPRQSAKGEIKENIRYEDRGGAKKVCFRRGRSRGGLKHFTVEEAEKMQSNAEQPQRIGSCLKSSEDSSEALSLGCYTQG